VTRVLLDHAVPAVSSRPALIAAAMGGKPSMLSIMKLL